MIEVRNLTKQYGDHVAVNDVSFTVNAGETFALLGPNGSGKTTLLKCLVGLVAPTQGEVCVNQFNLRKAGREARQAVSYLPQRVAFPENLTAREILSFYSQLRRVESGRVEELLATPQFHFNGFSNKPVNQYSGGMVQRLGLAVACLPDAPVLILDEPTVSLDPEGTLLFREFLAGLKRAGKTLLFSSHVLADVEQLADRVGIMVGGRLVALESVSALREGLMQGSRMRLDLDSSEPRYAEAARRAGARKVECEGNALFITSLPEDRLEILRGVETAGAKVVRFSSQEPSLEDVYLRYISRQRMGEGHQPNELAHG